MQYIRISLIFFKICKWFSAYSNSLKCKKRDDITFAYRVEGTIAYTCYYKQPEYIRQMSALVNNEYDLFKCVMINMFIKHHLNSSGLFYACCV